MTLISEIIYDAYRVSNILAIGASPTSIQTDEALRFLNRIVEGVYGFESGEQLTPFALGQANISHPSGYPWYGNNPDGEWYVPKNVRLILNLTASTEVYLHPCPNDGSRFAVVDNAQSLNINPLTVHGNGRMIESGQSILLDVDGTNQEWFFRADTNNWMKLTNLGLEDELPFPRMFDDMFIVLLAMRINPSYGAMLDPQSAEVLRKTTTKFQARYTQHIPIPSDLALLKLSKVSADRDSYYGYYGYEFGTPESLFNKGVPW